MEKEKFIETLDSIRQLEDLLSEAVEVFNSRLSIKGLNFYR